MSHESYLLKTFKSNTTDSATFLINELGKIYNNITVTSVIEKAINYNASSILKTFGMRSASIDVLFEDSADWFKTYGYKQSIFCATGATQEFTAVDLTISGFETSYLCQKITNGVVANPIELSTFRLDAQLCVLVSQDDALGRIGEKFVTYSDYYLGVTKEISVTGDQDDTLV